MVIKFNAQKSNFGSAQEKQNAANEISRNGPQDEKTKRLLEQRKFGQAQRRTDNFNNAQSFGANNPSSPQKPVVDQLIAGGKFGAASNFADTLGSMNKKPSPSPVAGMGNDTIDPTSMNIGQGKNPSNLQGQGPLSMETGGDMQMWNPKQQYTNANSGGIPSTSQMQMGDEGSYADDSGMGVMRNNQAPAGSSIAVNDTNTFQDTNINNQGATGKGIVDIGINQQGQGIGQAGDSAKAIEDAINKMKGLGTSFSEDLGGLENNASYGKTGQFADEAFGFLREAMGANVDPAFAANQSDFYGGNEELIKSQFSPEGFYGKQFNKSANLAKADLADRGFYRSSSDDGAQAALAADLQDRETAALLANRQAGRTELMDERGRISDTGTAAGGIAGDLGGIYAGLAGKSNEQDNILRNIILQAGGKEGDLAASLGALGIDIAGIGGANIGQGLDAQNEAINNYLSSLGLEAQIKMAEEILRNQFRQQANVNIQTNKQNKKNQAVIDEASGQILAA
jgi:hypothetical protein